MQMRLTWVSGDKEPQLVQYEGKSVESEVTTFTQEDMCGGLLNSREIKIHSSIVYFLSYNRRIHAWNCNKKSLFNFVWLLGN